MSGSFFGLNIAARGLFAAQRNLDVIGHNLNNVNTPGFSRQQGVQTASTPMGLNDGRGMLGTGAEVSAVNRIRDEYLDFKYWSENVAMGEWGAKRELLADMEATFNEPSDSGFNKTLDGFFTSLQELAKDPTSKAARSLVRQNGVTVAKYFNSAAAHFEKIQSDINYRVKTKVEEINSLASQIQQLNRQVYSSEIDGSTANDLRDQRTVIIDKLSKIANVEVSENIVGKTPTGKDEKHLVITISGKALVNHFSLNKLDVSQRTAKKNPEDIDKLYDVKWTDDGSITDIKGGELKGYLDVRDGNDGLNGSPMYKGVPHYIKKLDQFVRAFAMGFNEGFVDQNNNEILEASENGLGHVDGYRLNSLAGESPAGIRFFTMLDNDGKPMSSSTFKGTASSVSQIANQYDNLTAKNFSVSSDIINNPDLISTSGKDGQNNNLDNINALLDLRHNNHMFSEGAPEDFMKSMVASLGVDSQQAVKLSENQEAIVSQVDNRRISVSGVSVDEEMANMVRYQHTYNATAKMISTLQEVYETLINKLGV